MAWANSPDYQTLGKTAQFIAWSGCQAGNNQSNAEEEAEPLVMTFSKSTKTDAFENVYRAALPSISGKTEADCEVL